MLSNERLIAGILAQLTIFSAYKKLLEADEKNFINIFGNRAPERLASMFGKQSKDSIGSMKPVENGKRDQERETKEDDETPT